MFDELTEMQKGFVQARMLHAIEELLTGLPDEEALHD
jgi:hypothetical protein